MISEMGESKPALQRSWSMNSEVVVVIGAGGIPLVRRLESKEVKEIIEAKAWN